MRSKSYRRDYYRTKKAAELLDEFEKHPKVIERSVVRVTVGEEGKFKSDVFAILDEVDNVQSLGLRDLESQNPKLDNRDLKFNVKIHHKKTSAIGKAFDALFDR